jgi:hypothetical protein
MFLFYTIQYYLDTNTHKLKNVFYLFLSFIKQENEKIARKTEPK